MNYGVPVTGVTVAPAGDPAVIGAAQGLKVSNGLVVIGGDLLNAEDPVDITNVRGIRFDEDELGFSAIMFQSSTNAHQYMITGTSDHIDIDWIDTVGGFTARWQLQTTGYFEIIGATEHHTRRTAWVNDFVNVFTVFGDGMMNLGSVTAQGAMFIFESVSAGVMFPRMETGQKTTIPSPGNGLVVFDTTLQKLCVYAGGAWQTVTSV